MVITQTLVDALKRHQKARSELGGKNVRIHVKGGDLSEDSFTIGFDANPADDEDTVSQIEGLTIVMDDNTAGLLEGATIDIDEGGISISFKTPVEN